MRNLWKQIVVWIRQPDVICVLVIIVLTTGFLATTLRPGYTLLPLGLESEIAPWHKQVTHRDANLLVSDPFYIFYPRRELITESLQCGTLPLWNPYILGGHPQLGDVSAQTFYPPNLVIALFLTTARALPVLAWFHLVATGLLMYGFLRCLRVGSWPALFGAIAWMLNGYTIVWLENPHRLSTIAWLPGVLWMFEIGIRRKRYTYIAGAGILYGLQILGGQIQFAVGSAIVIGWYALFRAAMNSWQQHHFTWRPLVAVVLIGLIGVGMGMVQLAPAYELIQYSHRSPVAVSQLREIAWPLRHIVTLWIPDFYGNPVRGPYWGDSNFAEMTAYFGLLPLLFSLCAIPWSRRAESWFFSGLFVALLLLVWGTPIIYLVSWVPGFRYIALPRLLCFLPFMGSAAAAFALEDGMECIRIRPTRLWTAFAVIVIVLVAITVVTVANQHDQVAAQWKYLWPQFWRAGALLAMGIGALIAAHWRPGWAIAGLVFVLSVDVMQWGMPFNPVQPIDILYPDNSVTDWLRQDTSLYRVLPLQSDRVVFGPNVLSVFGIQGMDGYSSQVVQHYKELVCAINDQVDIWWMRPNRNMVVNSRFDPLFSILNVKYVLASHQQNEGVISVEASYAGCVDPLPLVGTTRITQSFQALHPGLNRIDIRFVHHGDPAGQPVRFRLWRDRADGELVADIIVDGADVPAEGATTFYFAPVSDSTGETFVWGVEAPDAAEYATVAVCRADVESAFSFAAYGVQLQYVNMLEGVWIYQNPNVLPRAYVVYRVEAVPEEISLNRLTARGFNPWTTALVDAPITSELASCTQTSTAPRMSPAQITSYQLHRVTIQASAVAPGILVLSDVWYPGWHVTVDGYPARLLRVNYALRGVYLPPGDHEIVFEFRPLSLCIGLATAVGAVSIALTVIWIDCVRAARH